MRMWLPAVIRVLAPNAGYGVSRMPETGGAVVAANHLNAIDPPVIGVYSRREIRYMTKVELLQIPIAGEFLRMTGTFAVRRGEGDRDSLRVARWLVREGHVVGMFMEGTRQKLGYPGPAHSGVAMVAMREGVPVVPIGVDAFGWSLKNRRRLAVAIGEPMDLSGFPANGRGYKEAAGLVEAEVVRAVAPRCPGRGRRVPRPAPRRHAAGAGGPGAGRRAPVGPARLAERGWAEGPLGPVYKAIA